MQRLVILAALGLACALYLADLNGMGLVGPDEPRYADVGRAMAQSGDWVTPRLWGKPWFEKPALLYWMTALGFRFGLGPDLAPRLPVAVLSLAFLTFFWWRLRLEWDTRVASCAAAMLATSAGWLTYSHVAVTDLPLAVFFSAAVLFALPWAAGREYSWEITASAACLGLAVLAKGLVPLILFLPVLVLAPAPRKRRLSEWFGPGPVLAFAVCALPWYVLCYVRNGNEFPQVFFVQQQFTRFSSAALQHVQPWWFYIPVLLLLLYPWFPILVLVRHESVRDPRLRVFTAIAGFGFLFFSASLNKLPGYLLPLLPAVSVVMATSLARAPRPAMALIAPLALLGALPIAAGLAPAALARGFRAAQIPWADLTLALIAAAASGTAIALTSRARAFPIAVVGAAAAFLWFQRAAFPAFDIAASARPVWAAKHPVCAPDGPRALLYGLYYYSGQELTNCSVLDPARTQVVR
jgi:4-amino-4-deoxy-L-arabinose transferase-like glycosyltransferase